MPFTKGHTHGKGRPKGSFNKSTAKVKEFFEQVFQDNMEQFQLDLKEFEPRERIKIMVDIAPYLAPKLKSIELKDDTVRDLKPFVINFVDTDGAVTGQSIIDKT